MSANKLNQKVDQLGLFFLIFGIIQLLFGLGLGLLYGLMGAGVGVLGAAEDEGALVAGGLMMGVGVFVAFMVLLFAIPMIATGRALRHKKRWSKVAGMIFGGLGIFNFPIGTALGVFSFIVLLDKEIDSVLTE